MPTLYELAKPIKETGPSGKVHRTAESVVKDLKPDIKALQPGYRILSPEEVAALYIPTQALKAVGIEGYQREDSPGHARKMAQSLLRGDEFPPISVSVWEGKAYCTDGQHRGLASIIARRSIPAVIRQRSPADQARLFANQRQAKPLNPDTVVLAAGGLFAEYVQDAVTSDHPWSDIVAFKRSPTKIGAAQMLNLLQVYVGGSMRQHTRETPPDERFDRGAADRLAELLLVFGSRKDNPLAWKPIGVRAITYAALKILRRTGERSRDVERWKRHMPGFPFQRFAHVTTSRELATELVNHWNKRLSDDRKVAP